MTTMEITATMTTMSNNKKNTYQGKCVFLGLGRSACSRAEYFSHSHGLGITMSVRPDERAGPVLPPLDDWLHELGLFAQNLPSIVVGHVLDPQPGEYIYDMCGAPGGKTSHLALMSNGQATIVMSDKSRRKVLAAQKFFHELGLCKESFSSSSSPSSCGIIPLHIDGTHCVEDRPGIPQKTVKEVSIIASHDSMIRRENPV